MGGLQTSLLFGHLKQLDLTMKSNPKQLTNNQIKDH
uniref:Uncharacterized protein n=1 Tax=Arundo donax TaxID=35708 RepID=A0A0A9AWB0_ARUDO